MRNIETGKSIPAWRYYFSWGKYTLSNSACRIIYSHYLQYWNIILEKTRRLLICSFVVPAILYVQVLSCHSVIWFAIQISSSIGMFYCDLLLRCKSLSCKGSRFKCSTICKALMFGPGRSTQSQVQSTLGFVFNQSSKHSPVIRKIKERLVLEINLI